MTTTSNLLVLRRPVESALAAAIRMEQAALWWLAQAHRHIECPDRHILLHPVAGSPTHNTTAVQIENDSEVEPAF